MPRFGLHLMGAYTGVAVGFTVGQGLRSGVWAIPVLWPVMVGLLASVVVVTAMGYAAPGWFALNLALFRMLLAGPAVAPMALPLAGAFMGLVVFMIERHQEAIAEAKARYNPYI